MKYFTKEWCFGELKDTKMDKINENYQKYIAGIYLKLPVALKMLVKNLFLHDGLIRNIVYFRSQKILEINGIFGDLQFGYYNLKIKYYGINEINTKILKMIFNDKKVEILKDEIEMLNSQQYSHRIIFSIGEEIEILFKDLSIEIIDEKAENYKKENCNLKII
ncbi:hypothetical protein KJ830_03815 [bacterium]|nr:hypothetical protein [bacterium]